MIRKFLASVSLLSILPLGKFMPNEKDLRGIVDYYPAAGLLFALIFYGIGMGLKFLPLLPAALLAALLPEAFTKCFHLDGLADTADAFLSGRSREQKLEIMKDSRIGTMGVAAIFSILSMKFAFFASIPSEKIPMILALMILGGRCGIVWYIAFSHYARAQGLGKLSFETKPRIGLFCSAFFISAAGYLAVGWIGILLLPVCGAAMFLWSRATHSVIGGATGDTIGAAEEFSELIFLIFASLTVFWRT